MDDARARPPLGGATAPGRRHGLTGSDSTALATRRRVWLLVALSLLMVAVAAIVPPVAQDPAYHAFADARTVLHVPNFLNVASNLPFLLVGALGLTFLTRDRRTGEREAFVTPGARQPYCLFFTGIALPASAPPTITGGRTPRRSSGTACR
jgi:hypothetical protein